MQGEANRQRRMNLVKRLGDRCCWRCALCTKPITESSSYPIPGGGSYGHADIDHIVPRALGGESEGEDNLRLVHADCNRSRGRQVRRALSLGRRFGWDNPAAAAALETACSCTTSSTSCLTPGE